MNENKKLMKYNHSKRRVGLRMLKFQIRRITLVPRHLLLILRYRLSGRKLAPKRFIIFGEGRCGSTALVSRLNSIKNVQCNNEVLALRVPFPFLHVLARCGLSKKPVNGCKILAFHIRDIQPIDDREGFLRQLYEKGFQIIHLRRENLINHAMSNIRAQRFGYHQRSPVETKKKKKVHVDTGELIRWMKRTEELYRYEDILLKDLPHLSLTYEGNIANEEMQKQTAIRVCEFLGLEPEEGKCEFRKVSPRSLRNSIENYDEVVRALEGTPYYKFLEIAEEIENGR